METLLLTDPMIKPDDSVLENVLGKKFENYKDFRSKITEIGFVLEWNYYKDQKGWLCKVLNKKKNVCWLSIWNTGFKLTFYFTEKTIEGIFELEINEKIKKTAKEMKPVGKLRPVIFLIENKKIMNDGIKLLKYKMEQK
jgi:hypothetical protein